MFGPLWYMLNNSSSLNRRRAYLATMRLSFALLHGRRDTYREPITSKAVTKSMLARLKSSIISAHFASINPLIHRILGIGRGRFTIAERVTVYKAPCRTIWL